MIAFLKNNQKSTRDQAQPCTGAWLPAMGPTGIARLVYVLLAAFWATMSPAQTLGTALEQSWARHPQAAAFTARETEALARADLAAGYLPAPPKLSLSNANDRLNAASGKDTWELELAMPVWLVGQRAAQQTAATVGLSDLSARRAALRLQLAGEVREAWWGVATARDALDMAKQREAAARHLQSDVQRRLQAGELARMEANLADIERLNAEAETQDAQGALDLALQAYRALTGNEAPVALPEETLATVAPAPDQHPQRIAADVAAEGAQARLALALTTTREAPELAVRWARDRSENGASYADSLGIKFTLPLGSASRARLNTATATAEVAEVEAEAALLQQRLSQDTLRAQRALQNARAQLDRAEQRWALASDAVKLSEKSYALGELDLAGLLRARALAWDAAAQRAKQRTALAASISRVNQSLGVMP